MDNNPDSPDSLSEDQLTVDLLSPREKRRLVINELYERNNQSTPDLNSKNTNNNDVGCVLMEDEHQENGTEEDDEVRILIYRWGLFVSLPTVDVS